MRDAVRKLGTTLLVLAVIWVGYEILTGLAFGQIDSPPAEDEITYADGYQIARFAGTQTFVVLKATNNPLQVLGVFDGWRQVGPPFPTAEAAEDHLWSLVHEPDRPMYERVAPSKYGKDLQTRVVELP